MNSAFLIKHNNKCYCSNCNEEIVINKNNPKEYIKRTHEKQCNISFVNFDNPRIADDIYAYNLKVINDELVLEILRGSFYDSFKFNKVYEAFFTKNSRIVKESGEENIYYWKEILKENFFYEDIYQSNRLNLNSEAEISIINEVFPYIPFIENISDFIDIYLTKGYTENKKLLDKELAKIPHQKIDLNIGNIYNRKNLCLCYLKEHEVLNEVFFEVTYIEGKCINGKINIIYKNRCLISDNYIYNPKNMSLDLLNSNNILYLPFRYEKFSNKYKHIKLKEYIKSGGKKIIPFIFSSTNNRCLELLGKSELGYLADNYQNINDIDLSGTNVKSIFGIPIKALKCLNSKDFIEYINVSQKIKPFVDLYNYQRMVYFETFNKSTIEFLRQNMFKNNSDVYDFDKKDILKYIKYTQSKVFENYNDKNIVYINIYTDYLNMCNRNNLYPEGRFPKNLIHCHDLMCHYQKERIEANRNAAFIDAIKNPRYQNLKTDAVESDEFVILLPRTADDLVEESYQMHNCVRSYVEAVARGSTYILFLRHNKKRSNSYITIEVSANYYLRQVKASHNAEPPIKVIEFVKKWAKEKNIIIDNCYDLKYAS
jgi:hypothetical protein